jgi:hypothetical protein
MNNLVIDPDNQSLLDYLKGVKEGSKFIDSLGHEVVVESIFNVPTHFAWHQRVFDPGIILHVTGTNIRVYIEAEKVGIVGKNTGKGFEDKQVDKTGKVLPADRGLDRTQVHAKPK